MKWVCPQCDYVTVDNPRKGRQKALCPICKTIGGLRMFALCPCGNWFHAGNYTYKTCSKECRYLYSKKGGKKGKKYPHLQRARKGNCLVCGNEYRATKDFKKYKQKYCSLNCKEKDWETKVRPLIKLPPPQKGELRYNWKGDDASYHAIHQWVARELGTKRECEHCGRTNQKKYEWCNKDHQYRRVKDDWMRLCTSCHRKYDMAVHGSAYFGNR